MPSFDIVSEVDTHELTNAVDQANRELTTRFDFKGVEAKFELEESTIKQSAPSDFQVQQMTEEELLAFLFLPGFSMSQQVTEVSGRGVGLDNLYPGVMGIGLSVGQGGVGKLHCLHLRVRQIVV